MLNLRGLGLDDQVREIFQAFFPSFHTGRWHGLDYTAYLLLCTRHENQTKVLLSRGADPDKLLAVYKQLVASDEVARTGSILLLGKGLDRFYAKSMDYLAKFR